MNLGVVDKFNNLQVQPGKSLSLGDALHGCYCIMPICEQHPHQCISSSAL